MAQVIPGFAADQFRAGVRLAMRMSLPAEAERWPEFVIPTSPAGAGIGWDIDAPAVEAAERLERPLCVIERAAAKDEQHPWGPLQEGSIAVTLLDEEYRLVKGFSHVNLWLAAQEEPVPYYYKKVLEQPTLDTVGVWIIECTAKDEV